MLEQRAYGCGNSRGREAQSCHHQALATHHGGGTEMTHPIAKLLLDTIELRAGSVITKREIDALKRRWCWRTLFRINPNQNPLGQVYDEIEMVFGSDRDIRYQVDAELTASGLAWWRAAMFRKDGTLRETQFVREIDDHPYRDYIVRILHDFNRFELVDWYVDMNAYGMFSAFPVYAMLGRSSVNGVRYIARPWQSGGRTEVLGV
jgi:hypothetical protein